MRCFMNSLKCSRGNINENVPHRDFLVLGFQKIRIEFLNYWDNNESSELSKKIVHFSFLIVPNLMAEISEGYYI